MSAEGLQGAPGETRSAKCHPIAYCERTVCTRSTLGHLDVKSWPVSPGSEGLGKWMGKKHVVAWGWGAICVHGTHRAIWPIGQWNL